MNVNVYATGVNLFGCLPASQAVPLDFVLNAVPRSGIIPEPGQDGGSELGILRIGS